MPNQSLRRPWFGGFRFTVRSLMVVVLVFAAVSGWIAHLKGLSTLESLMLRGHNDVTDAGAAHLAKMISLKELYLENSQISDAGVAYVGKLTRLETLNLARAQIGDEGIAHLDGLTRLENLGLDGTRIGDDGLVRLWEAGPHSRPFI